ncbi:uncharacterized protein [Oryza sativa Japonica Group]|uniref:uncharacterized protein isoform X2 n=1 Tax=Oryza sativa subsp. japonica TaxID=39947 RepID=UPI0007753FD0|nr:uncharacterized protein LOC9268566 isoform X2 [Oryza sativa Japonica Group]
MAPKRKVNESIVANLPIPDPSMPIKIPGDSKIEIQNRSRNLTVYASKVVDSVAYNAMLSYPEGQQEKCVAVCRRLEHAHALFDILASCSHSNIIEPIGIWEEKGTKLAYIVFPCFDGPLSLIPTEEIFDVEDATNDKSYTFGFTDQGCKIFVEMFMAVKYVNDLYDDEQIPLKALNFDESKIFYQLNAQRDYRVLLTDFKLEISPTGNARNNRKGKGKASSTVPTVDELKVANWNGLGQLLQKLHKNLGLHAELNHFAELLGKKTVKYEDLVWEAGLWEHNSKVQFIREIYWHYNNDEAKISQLKLRASLGLKSCIDKLEVNKSREPNKEINDKSLYNSLFFLRVYMVAHRDDLIKGYSGAKETVEDRKAVVRLLMKECPTYMVKLIAEIRHLGWIKESPFLRKDNQYMREFYPPKAAK